MALTIACDIHPLNNLRVLTFLETSLHQNEAARNACTGQLTVRKDSVGDGEWHRMPTWPAKSAGCNGFRQHWSTFVCHLKSGSRDKQVAGAFNQLRLARA